MTLDLIQLKADINKLNDQIESLNYSYKTFDIYQDFITNEREKIEKLRNSLYTSVRICDKLKRKKRKFGFQKKISSICLIKKRKVEEKDFVNNQLTPAISFECSLATTLPDNSNKGENEIIFKFPEGFQKKCYICKIKYSEVHSFYDQLCFQCAKINYDKRNQNFNFEGKIALVTGCRIKIGYQICLFLLRNKCRVIGTSRFSKDAFLRFSKEQDFDSFKELITIFPLDLRDIRSVDKFITYLNTNFEKLDILINNAAQTLRHSTQFYKHLLDIETKPLESFQNVEIYKILPYQDRELWSKSTNISMIEGNDHNTVACCVDNEDTNNNDVSLSFMQSQIKILKEDFTPDTRYFPINILDKDQQQVDLTEKNSWKLEIDDINLFEFAETQFINSFSPFFLCSRLKKLMSNGDYESRYIVNVSSMEGKFNRRFKSTQHCHTNMSKASLNMLTRTCGRYFAKYKIFMTSVDTGWVSEMNPSHLFNYDRTVPLDELDGAMRVLDPIIEGYTKKKYLHSVFLKDYKETEW
jgi:NAD(P)-dependent dehydrogenase (short-subunit alcohol dehydrogenase family)